MATTLKNTLAQLKSLGDEKVRAHNKKYGAGDNQFGVKLGEVRKFAARLHAKDKAWQGEAFGWQAEYNPEKAEPPLESRMAFTPADFCIGESGNWFFSLMWEHGRDADPVEFLDDKNILKQTA